MPGGNQCGAEALAESDRLLQIQVREPGEHYEGDHLLDRLQLCWVIDRAAVTIRRHREAIFDEGQAPTDKDHISDRHLFVAKMPIPGGRHEYTGGLLRFGAVISDGL